MCTHTTVLSQQSRAVVFVVFEPFFVSISTITTTTITRSPLHIPLPPPLPTRLPVLFPPPMPPPLPPPPQVVLYFSTSNPNPQVHPHHHYSITLAYSIVSTTTTTTTSPSMLIYRGTMAQQSGNLKPFSHRIMKSQLVKVILLFPLCVYCICAALEVLLVISVLRGRGKIRSS